MTSPDAGRSWLDSLFCRALWFCSRRCRQLDRKTNWPLLLLCALTIAGLVLTQYKTGVIFAVLAVAIVGNQCVRVIVWREPARRKYFLRILVRAFVVVALALLLSAPKLNAVLHAKAGKNLQRIVLDAPAPDPNALARPSSIMPEFCEQVLTHRKK